MPTTLPDMSTSGAARIAGIDGGVGLDEELVVGDADLRPRQRRDDAARHRLADAEGVADREHQVTDLELVGIAELGKGQVALGALHLEHGEVGPLIAEHHLAIEFAAVAERHLDLVRIGDDVVVGDDDPGGIDDDAGAEGLLDALRRRGEVRPAAEEAAEEGIVEERRLRLGDDAGGVDIDHRRRDPLDDRREGILDLGRGFRDDPPLFGKGRQRNSACRNHHDGANSVQRHGGSNSQAA